MFRQYHEGLFTYADVRTSVPVPLSFSNFYRLPSESKQLPLHTTVQLDGHLSGDPHVLFE